MRVFKNKWFVRFARQENISDSELNEAIRRAERGQIDANLGGDVIKQRIARHGEGKSGGYRSIILYRSSDKAFFVYGFAKSQQDNISSDETKEFKKLGKQLLSYEDKEINRAVKAGALIEVEYDVETQS